MEQGGTGDGPLFQSSLMVTEAVPMSIPLINETNAVNQRTKLGTSMDVPGTAARNETSTTHGAEGKDVGKKIKCPPSGGTSSPPTRLSGPSSQLSLPSATAASQPHQRRLAPFAETGSPDRLNVTSSTAGRSSRRSTRRQRRKSGRPRSQSSKTAKPHSPSSRSKMTRTSSSSR